jgi:hypothetical protein
LLHVDSCEKTDWPILIDYCLDANSRSRDRQSAIKKPGITGLFPEKAEAYLVFGTCHILTTAHRRFNLAMSIRAFRNMHSLAFVSCYRAVNQLGTAFTTRHIADAHTTYFAFVRSH